MLLNSLLVETNNLMIVDFTTIIGLIALSQAILLVLFLTFSGARFDFVGIINAVLVVVIVGLGHDVLLHSRLSLWFPQAVGFGPVHTYLIGPLVFLLTLKLVNPKSRYSKWQLLHFAPFVWQFVSRIPVMFQSSADKLQVLERYYSMPNSVFSIPVLSWENIIGLITFYGHRFIYIAAAIFLLTRSTKAFEFVLPARQIARRFIICSLVIYSLLWLSIRIGLYIPTIGQVLRENTAALNSIGLSLITIVIALGLFRFRVDEIFSTQSLRKYEKSGLDESSSKLIFAEIDEVLKRRELFTMPDLKQADLAKEVGLSNQQISQAINQIQNESFNEYLNKLRIEYFQRLISKRLAKETRDPKIELMHLANESGFSSKATFYRVFKDQIGMTPTQYINSLQKQ